ncbi:flagellar hook-length control protein FliK [Crenobacter luteus]|uniref:flagellar hook-length control protein FliK n=1 Tax=Crenobacter luteus TaxID=1452487 RepID=UPI0010433C6A|nr:flagellar hook-length control protein FliK [Crenobacter luteus]TCP15607.1 flagellar hook-length control protein FliK [Crenobacter luteus]
MIASLPPSPAVPRDAAAPGAAPPADADEAAPASFFDAMLGLLGAAPPSAEAGPAIRDEETAREPAALPTVAPLLPPTVPLVPAPPAPSTRADPLGTPIVPLSGASGVDAPRLDGPATPIWPQAADARAVAVSAAVPLAPALADATAPTVEPALAPREGGPSVQLVGAWAPPPAPSDPAPEWAPLKLPPGKPEVWGESLRAALGERLSVQSAHGIDRALIRLDPPQFGSLEIAIRHEGGALSVQLVASSGEVVRQLQAIGEVLRQDLASRQYTQVAVEVREGAAQGQGQGQRQGREPERDARQPGRALAEAGDAAAPFALDRG